MERYAIQKIYKNYFGIIDSYFGSIKHYLGDDEDSHIELGIHMANYPLISDLILDAIDDLDSEIFKFWNENAKSIFDYTRNQNVLKCLYSGDITPVVLENFVKKSSLYIDTVVIPDPIFNLSLVPKHLYVNKKYFLAKLIRHIFNIWKLKDLLLADSKEDIIIILPISLQTIGKKKKDSLIGKAKHEYIDYVNRITLNNFKNIEETSTFLDTINTSQDLFSNLNETKLLPSVFQSINSLDMFLEDFTEQKIKEPFCKKSIGWNFRLYLQSQFIRVQEHKYFCEIWWRNRYMTMIYRGSFTRTK
jgi:hypothetical protein